MVSGQAPESKMEVVSRLMRQGGYILVAGGGVNDLDKRIREHPQILLWDDNDSSILHREIPTNTRAVIYNRWLSHALAGRLRNAAQKLGCPVFPMLRSREIKELLGELIQETEPVVPETAPMLELVDEIPPAEVHEVEAAPLIQESDLRKPYRGELAEKIFSEQLKMDAAIGEETDRLLPIVRALGIKQSRGALVQAITKYKKGANYARGTGTKTFPHKDGKAKSPETTSTVKSSDDFTEAARMLKDARAAIDLLIDFMPKLSREVIELRKKQDKLRALLE